MIVMMIHSIFSMEQNTILSTKIQCICIVLYYMISLAIPLFTLHIFLNRDFFTDMAGFLSDQQLTLVGVSRMVLLDDDELSQCRLL